MQAFFSAYSVPVSLWRTLKTSEKPPYTKCIAEQVG